MRGALLVLLLLVSAALAHAELPSASAAMVHQALTSGKPVILDFGARQCISCQKMAPVLEELSVTYRGRASVLFVDVRQDRAAAGTFGIQMIPTQIFFDARGKEVKRHVGYMERVQLVDGLQAAGLQ